MKIEERTLLCEINENGRIIRVVDTPILDKSCQLSDDGNFINGVVPIGTLGECISTLKHCQDLIENTDYYKTAKTIRQHKDLTEKRLHLLDPILNLAFTLDSAKGLLEDVLEKASRKGKRSYENGK